jgi:AraC-like DNA-binding protein
MFEALTFLHGDHYPSCTASVDKHFVGYASLQLMTRGSIGLRYDREAFSMEGRWCWAAYPGPRIAFQRSAPCASWNHRYVAFRGPLLTRWLSEGLLPRHPQPAPESQDFERDFDFLHACMRSSDHWSQRRALNLLERLLLQLAAERTAQVRTETWLEEVVTTIERPEPYSIEQLAQRCGMAVSTLRRRFQAVTGASIHAHAISCRLSLASRRLRDSNDPIARIAEELGYEDVSFFTRQFRRHVGMAPAAYRRSR